MSDDEGSLTLVATPIGNLGDLSPRAVEALSLAETWYVEDSRVSGKLASHLGLKKPMRVVNDHTADFHLDRYVKELKAGSHAALLTDGGSPVVSDPGAQLVDRCREAGVRVESVPGPSAVVNALGLSGFFGQRFAFLGFLGRKAGDIRKEIEPFQDSPLTLVLFESPHRLLATLEVLAQALPGRRYAVCREMTKMFEQVYRARLPNLPAEDEIPLKGEITLVVEGKRRNRVED